MKTKVTLEQEELIASAVSDLEDAMNTLEKTKLFVSLVNKMDEILRILLAFQIEVDDDATDFKDAIARGVDNA